MAKRIADTLHSASVHLSFDRAAINAEDEKGRRYHFWVLRKSRKLMDDVLFFKAPLGKDGKSLDHGQPGYFATRQLDATEPRNAGIVKRMWELVDAAGLWDAALLADFQAEEAKRAKLEIRAQRIAKELAADELHAALLKLVAIVERGTATLTVVDALAEAHEALRLAGDTTRMAERRQALEARYGL